MLNRFLTAKKEDARGPKDKRPYLATECSDLHEADKWRYQIIKEIGKKVMEIQNAGLGEHKCALARSHAQQRPALHECCNLQVAHRSQHCSARSTSAGQAHRHTLHQHTQPELHWQSRSSCSTLNI